MIKSINKINDYKLLQDARVLVIGASSFIGTHLVLKLLEYGAVVHATYRSDRPVFPQKVMTEYLDLTDLDAVKNRLRHFQPDYIFNMAAFVDGSRDLDMVLPTMQANLGGNLNLLVATAKVPIKRLILIGSMDEYQEASKYGASPPSPYAASKMASSAYAKMFYKLYKVPVSIARIFMVYGPRQKDTRKLIPYTITALLKGEAPSFGSGERMVDWIYISDVVDGLIKMAVTPGLNGETICLGSGNLVSVKEVICQIFRQMNISQPPKFGILPERPLETSVVAQTKRTRTMINWQTTVNMETGLGNTVNWYRQRYSSIAIRDPYSGNFKNKSI